MSEYGVYLSFAREVSARAGRLVRDSFLGVFGVDAKGDIDLVTDVDRRSETFLVEEIGRRFPDHGVLAEEGGARAGSGEWRWFIDPLDGTINFAHGYPMVAVSLALEREGSVVVGVVHDPLRQETFWAERGEGAACDRGPISPSRARTLLQSLASTGFPYDKNTSAVDNLGNFARVTKEVRGIRRGGSAVLDLAYVAAGRLDAFWELKLAPWDVAAGVLIVGESGGRVTRFDGSPFNAGDVDLVASNGLVHDELRSHLRIEG